MSLVFHKAVATPANISNKSPDQFIDTSTANWTLGKTELQAKSDALEDGVSSLFREGLLTCPSVSYSGASLAVTLGSFKALIGSEVAHAGGTFTAIANQASPANCYLTQDGTLVNVVPTTKSYAIIATYTSNGSGVLTFTLTNKILIPALVTVTDTIEGIVVPDSPGYYDGYWDHSATYQLTIPGFVTMTVDPVSDFYVELLYNGLVHSDSNTLNDPPHNQTEGGIWYRVSRKQGYYYAGNSTVDLTLSRSGIIIAV
jgi:hypothetical protein